MLPEGALDRLLSGSAVAEYPKGTILFHEGDPCDAIWLIISGRCEARMSDSNGHGIVEEVFGPGDTLGERAFLNREPHHRTFVVATHAVLLRIPVSELEGLFKKDPVLAGRFSQAVVSIPRGSRSLGLTGGTRVRRIVSLLPLSPRVESLVVAHQLAEALHTITHQSVLLVRLESSPSRSAASDWPPFGSEFCFRRQLRRETGFDELQLAPREMSGIAPLISHCGQHYDFVLLLLAPEASGPTTIECLIESDLAFVLVQPSTQNLYDFQLLIREVCSRTHGDCAHVKPVLLAEESIAAADFQNTLRQLGHPLHSIARGFPPKGGSPNCEPRFALHVRRLAREIGRCRVGLALSSGGAKGLAHIGVIQVLEEHGIEIDCVAGSSMGAYVAAIWAYGLDGVRLEKIARELEGRWGLRHLIDPSLPPRRGFLRTRRTIARLRKSIGDARFSDLVRPLRIVSTRLETLERVVFSSGDVASAVEASIAIPGVCVPVMLDGENYIDGGISDPLPVDLLDEMGIERIIAVNVIPPPERIRFWLDSERELNGREPEPSRFSRFFNRHLNYVAPGNILDTMMRAINGAQTRVAEAAARNADVVLRPLAGDAVWHDFTRPQKYIALGRATAEAQLSELLALTTHPAPDEHLPPLAPFPRIAA